MNKVDEEKNLGPGSAANDLAEPADPVNRFEITWHGFHYGYRVSIPNYEGGDVVKAEAFDALSEAVEKAITQLETATRAGNLSAYQMMHNIKRDLAAALTTAKG